MNLVHEQVKHLKFGIGTVAEQTDTLVEVKFANEIGIKKFIYPEAFENFLELCDPSSREKLNNELLDLRKEIDLKRKANEDEIKRHLAEMRQAQVKQKRAEPKKGVASKKKPTKNDEFFEAEEHEEQDSDFETEA